MKKILLIALVFFSINSFCQEQNTENKLSQSEIRSFILSETKQSGKLDFFTPIKGKEYNGSQIKPGVFASNIEVALYRWGKANYELRVENVETALMIFGEFKGREPNGKEKSLITMGFERKLEQ